MNDYQIYADSACDISPSLLAEWDVKYCSLSFLFDDSEKSYQNDEMSAADFYKKIREGHSAVTSSVNSETFLEVFRTTLEAGKDLLYIGFSSGLSATYASACAAIAELREAFPERKILAVDSLAASAGYGLLLYLTVQKKKQGATIEEAAAFAEDTKLHICHWFTVDDLKALLKGGRVKKAIGALGGALDLKPVLHMDNAGHLIPMSIARGRKGSLKAIVKKYGELALHPGKGPIFISNGDCLDDVKRIEEMLKEKYGPGLDLIADVGPVIGSHTGAGVLALFFEGKER